MFQWPLATFISETKTSANCESIKRFTITRRLVAFGYHHQSLASVNEPQSCQTYVPSHSGILQNTLRQFLQFRQHVYYTGNVYLEKKDWNRGEPLGSGVYGSCYIVRDNDFQMPMALKEVCVCHSLSLSFSVCLSVCTHVYMCVCVGECEWEWGGWCLCVYVGVGVFVHMYMCVFVYVYVYVCTCVYTYYARMCVCFMHVVCSFSSTPGQPQQIRHE